MPNPKRPEERSWIEQYWKVQLRAGESRQKWLWRSGSLPELGLLLKLFTFGFWALLFPFRIAFRAWRRHKKRSAFHSYLYGEEPR